MSIQEYINAHRERFMEEWASLIRIPSVSCEASHKADMQRCAERWRELLLEAGCQKAQVISASNPSECPEAPSDGNPFVYAEFKCENEKIGKCENEKIGKCENEKIGKCENEKIPTVLVYAHYDVMPVEPLDAWHSDPWEPSVRNGRLYARGADDDKGQAMIQAKAFEYMAKTGQLRCNVKFIFEGEEEIGSPSLEAFLENHKDLLKADIILVSDTSMIGKDTPSITTGLRGLAYWQIEVDGPNRDLHSGHFGGAVKNPVNALCEMIAQVVDKDGRITIPHFYDDVLPIPDEERRMIAEIPFSQEAYNKAIDVDDVFGEQGYSTLERNSCRPSFDVCGIWGGYTGEGSKTVLPSKAFAKVSCRLVANQDHEKISRAFIEYMESLAPKGVRVRVTPMHGGQGYVCPIDIPAYKAAEKGFEEAFGKRPLAARRGGSIPIISAFERILGCKTILMGFGLEQNAIHSPNESMDLEVWEKGIIAVTGFYKALTENQG
ncbi:MAG: dipeptidase [Paludibacteraceae bacterium]|nr:dipeptidase [Paludibacteraceae bacterium]